MLPYVWKYWNCGAEFYNTKLCPDCQPKYVTYDGKCNVCGKFLYQIGQGQMNCQPVKRTRVNYQGGI